MLAELALLLALTASADLHTLVPDTPDGPVAQRRSDDRAVCGCRHYEGRIYRLSEDATSTSGAPSDTTVLIASGSRIRSASYLPSGLRCLDLSDTLVTNVSYLPASLEVLILSGTRVRNVSYLPRGLRVLDLSDTPVTNVSYSPSSLEVLILSGTRVRNVSYLPRGLRVLDLSDTLVTNVSYLPSSLEVLILSGTDVTNVSYLPRGLRALDLSDTDVSSVSNLPDGLRYLDLRGSPAEAGAEAFRRRSVCVNCPVRACHGYRRQSGTNGDFLETARSCLGRYRLRSLGLIRGMNIGVRSR